MRPSEALSVDRVSVGPGRLVASVRVADGHPLRTSARPGLAPAVCALLPGIARHRCECGSAHGIIPELADTEVAHLLEHVALELMALSGSPRSLRGSTEWDFAADGAGVFRVALEYDDDLVALGALRASAEIVNALLDGDPHAIDIPAVTRGLAAARSR